MFPYPYVDLYGLGAGGSSGSTWDILSDDSEGSHGLIKATVVLSEVQTHHTIY